MLGEQFPQTYASLLHRMVPLQMSADVQGGVTAINIMPVPAGMFATPEALAKKLQDPDAAVTIEHEPTVRDLREDLGEES